MEVLLPNHLGGCHMVFDLSKRETSRMIPRAVRYMRYKTWAHFNNCSIMKASETIVQES